MSQGTPMIARCEFCQQFNPEMAFRVYEVVEEKPVLEHSAMVCPSCYAIGIDFGKKVDPFTGNLEPFFRPWEMVWGHHFYSRNGWIFGKTPIGRATATYLFRYEDRSLRQQLLEFPIINVVKESNPNLYQHLLFLKNERRRGDLGKGSALLSRESLANLDKLKKSPWDFEFGKYVYYVLQIESIYIRGDREGLKNGIHEGHFYLNHVWKRSLKGAVGWRSQILNSMSIMYQQLATLELAERILIDGDQLTRIGGLVENQLTSYQLLIDSFSNANFRDGDPLPVVSSRLASLQGKYRHNSASKTQMQEVILNLKTWDIDRQLNGLKFIVDLAPSLSSTKESNLIEHMAMELDAILSQVGYGQFYDATSRVSIRRRWWPLVWATKADWSRELLKTDLQFWISRGMKNEVNELIVALWRWRHCISTKTFEIALATIRDVYRGSRRGDVTI
jgi:hypothetical protein